MMSMLYVENWSLAAQSVDYSALNNQATVAQHYWSLSVEEQFYFVWPLALYGFYYLGMRKGASRRALFRGVTALALGSLAFSIYYTSTNPSPAYFSTPVRVWEFAFGGILALVASQIVLSRTSAAVVAMTGWILICTAALGFSPETQFPGWSALLPVIGTVAVIAGGMNQVRSPLYYVLSWKPIQLIGDVSYSIYLWHWPMIVVAPFFIGSPLSSWHKITIVVFCVPLAWATKLLVEDKGKSWRILGQQSRTTFAVMGVGIVILGLISGGLMIGAEKKQDQALASIQQLVQDPCAGPAALPISDKCHDPLGAASVTVMSEANRYYNSAPECVADPASKRPGVESVVMCDYSAGIEGAETVWLTGDSHAEQWKPALLKLAKAEGWKLRYALLGGCPVADVNFKGYRGNDSSEVTTACMTGAQSIAALIEEEKPDKVFYSIFAREERIDDGSGRSQQSQYIDALPKFWNRWTDGGSTVVVLADPPLNGTVRDSNCVIQNPNKPLNCAVDRNLAHPPDPLVMAANSVDSPQVKLVDMTDHFCDAALCYAVVGHMPVYYDADHLNGEYSTLMAPFIARKIYE